jgi:TDG/mug DNA glycosylase family protein
MNVPLRPIPDHLAPNLRLLFVGYNPGIRSSETGHHYANPSNRFWKIIHEAGITDRRYRPEEDQDLLKLGIGFTNIVARPTKTAAEITKQEYEEGARLLLGKLTRFRPQVACYVGKGVYEELSGRRDIDWGRQPHSVIEGVIDYVVPSSSGLVRMPLPDIISIYAGILPLIRA